jgi:hypothetical protein
VVASGWLAAALPPCRAGRSKHCVSASCHQKKNGAEERVHGADEVLGRILTSTEGVGEIREAYVRCSALREDPDAPSLHFTTA